MNSFIGHSTPPTSDFFPFLTELSSNVFPWKLVRQECWPHKPKFIFHLVSKHVSVSHVKVWENSEIENLFSTNQNQKNVKMNLVGNEAKGLNLKTSVSRKTKHAKFSGKRTFLIPWYAHVATCSFTESLLLMELSNQKIHTQLHDHVPSATLRTLLYIIITTV